MHDSNCKIWSITIALEERHTCTALRVAGGHSSAWRALVAEVMVAWEIECKILVIARLKDATDRRWCPRRHGAKRKKKSTRHSIKSNFKAIKKLIPLRCTPTNTGFNKNLSNQIFFFPLSSIRYFETIFLSTSNQIRSESSVIILMRRWKRRRRSISKSFDNKQRFWARDNSNNQMNRIQWDLLYFDGPWCGAACDSVGCLQFGALL